MSKENMDNIAENAEESFEKVNEETAQTESAVNDTSENEPDVASILAGEADEDRDLLKEMKQKAKEEKRALKEKLKEEKRAAKEEKKKKKADDSDDINIVKDLISIFIYMLIVVILCLLIITFVGQRTTVNGDSMNPTLENGDNLWIDKLAYKIGEPERYDIVVFPEQDVFYIKRIVGLPGETVRIDEDGNLFINEQLMEDPYSQIRMTSAGDVGGDGIKLGEGEYFVLGDNRNNSHDSRDQNVVGNITKKRITGKAVFRLTPFSKFGKLKKAEQ